MMGEGARLNDRAVEYRKEDEEGLEQQATISSFRNPC